MMNNFQELNEIGCIDELESKLSQIVGILTTLEISMHRRADFQAIQDDAKYSVVAAYKLADDCKKINNQIYALLPRIK